MNKRPEPRTRVERNIQAKKQQPREDVRTSAMKNKGSKKGTNTIGILFIVLIVCIIGAFFIASSKEGTETAGYFNKEDKIVADELYEKVMTINEDSYPQTPEEVVTLYTEGYKLLYGNKIKDLTIVPNILEKQRILLSNEIISKNSFEEQEKNVLSSIENLKKNKVYITNISVKPVTYDNKDNNKAYIRVETNDNLFQTYYYLYYLQRGKDGKWRITGWYNTDENYNII